MKTKASTLLLALLLVGAGCLGVSGDESSETATASEDPRDEEAASGSNEDDPDDGDTSPQEGEGEEHATDNGTEVTSVWKNTTIRGANPGLDLHWVSGDNGLPFDVPDGAEAVVVEAAWSENVAVNLSVNDPDGPECDSQGPVSTYFDCEPTRAEAGESHLLVRVAGEDVQAGGWAAEVFVDSPIPQQAQVTLVASVVEEGDVPEDFARLP